MNYLKIIASLILCFIFIPATIFSQSEEYILKGVTLEKFTRFIDWPEELDMADTTKPFIIGVFGKTPFNNILEELYSNREIKKKQVIILKLSNKQKLDQCHVVYIAGSEKKNLNDIIKTIGRKPILMVGDTDGFSEKGIHINFYVEDNKLRFEINETAIRDSGFHVSYLLLKHARIINPWGNSK